MKIRIPVSIGELFDKISILEIKKEMIRDKEKYKIIKYELSELKSILKKKSLLKSNILDEYKKLKRINKILWNIEDSKRKHESKKIFNKQFIELSRKVYIYNDKRAKIKNSINEKYGSKIKEVKSYERY